MVSEGNSCTTINSGNQFETTVFIENNGESRSEAIRPKRIRSQVKIQIPRDETFDSENQEITEVNTSRIEQMQLQVEDAPKRTRIENGWIYLSIAGVIAIVILLVLHLIVIPNGGIK